MLADMPGISMWASLSCVSCRWSYTCTLCHNARRHAWHLHVSFSFLCFMSLVLYLYALPQCSQTCLASPCELLFLVFHVAGLIPVRFATMLADMPGISMWASLSCVSCSWSYTCTLCHNARRHAWHLHVSFSFLCFMSLVLYLYALPQCSQTCLASPCELLFLVFHVAGLIPVRFATMLVDMPGISMWASLSCVSCRWSYTCTLCHNARRHAWHLHVSLSRAGGQLSSMWKKRHTKDINQLFETLEEKKEFWLDSV